MCFTVVDGISSNMEDKGEDQRNLLPLVVRQCHLDRSGNIRPIELLGL